jgi:hypothetical protein
MNAFEAEIATIEADLSKLQASAGLPNERHF